MKVYKYRYGDTDTFERDISSLESDYYWAPTRHNLNDPCEGLFSKNTIDGQLDLIESIFVKNKPQAQETFNSVRDALRKVLEFVDLSGIYSLSTTPTDELLWAHYSNSHNGFCIGYDFDKLNSFTENENHKIFIEYSNKPPEIDINNIVNTNAERILQKILGTKSKKWSYEKEVRIITSESGKQYYDFRSVKEIYFGLRMPTELQAEIMHRLFGRGISYYKILLNNYLLKEELIEDGSTDYPKYKYSIAPIAEGAITPEYVNKKYKKYTTYLYKAGEIVRREPYCNLVEMVEFSWDKSTPEKPVIFVQYKRSEYRWVNHYLTLKDIDDQYAKISDL
jgi:hypothetical protein